MDRKSKLPHTCSDCTSREIGIFCHLSNPELEEISKHKISNTYKKGQTLFLQGNPTYGIFCISKGVVKIGHIGANGQESIIKIATDGDIVGVKCLYTEEYYTSTATIVEDSVICFLDKKYINKLVQEKPSIAGELILKLSKDLGAAEHKVNSMFQKNVRERLAELLLILKESFGDKDLTTGKIKLNIKLTRDEMAAMIGTASETLIRFMSELKNDGIIEQFGKTIIINREDELIKLANIED
jgi:CRP-like cAMP-binding protein